MAYGLVCFDASIEDAEQRCRHRKYWHWYYSNGEPFPKTYIGTQWSNSTLWTLNRESGGILFQIVEPTDNPVQLNSPRVKKLIQQLKDHHSCKSKDCVDKKSEHGPHGEAYLTIENIIATFDKMVEEFGDRAWVAPT